MVTCTRATSDSRPTAERLASSTRIHACVCMGACLTRVCGRRWPCVRARPSAPHVSYAWGCSAACGSGGLLSQLGCRSHGRGREMPPAFRPGREPHRAHVRVVALRASVPLAGVDDGGSHGCSLCVGSCVGTCEAQRQAGQAATVTRGSWPSMGRIGPSW